MLPNPLYRANFVRRDWNASAACYPSENQSEGVTAILQLREFKPYLKQRLRDILEAGQSLKLQDEVDSISFYLEVMSDSNADDSHGIDTLRSYMSKLYDMQRRNPAKAKSEKTDESPTVTVKTKDEDDEAAAIVSSSCANVKEERLDSDSVHVAALRDKSAAYYDWRIKELLEKAGDGGNEERWTSSTTDNNCSAINPSSSHTASIETQPEATGQPFLRTPPPEFTEATQQGTHFQNEIARQPVHSPRTFTRQPAPNMRMVVYNQFSRQPVLNPRMAVSNQFSRQPVPNPRMAVSNQFSRQPVLNPRMAVSNEFSRQPVPNPRMAVSNQFSRQPVLHPQMLSYNNEFARQPFFRPPVQIRNGVAWQPLHFPTAYPYGGVPWPPAPFYSSSPYGHVLWQPLIRQPSPPGYDEVAWLREAEPKQDMAISMANNVGHLIERRQKRIDSIRSAVKPAPRVVTSRGQFETTIRSPTPEEEDFERLDSELEQDSSSNSSVGTSVVAKKGQKRVTFSNDSKKRPRSRTNKPNSTKSELKKKINKECGAIFQLGRKKGETRQVIEEPEAVSSSSSDSGMRKKQGRKKKPLPEEDLNFTEISTSTNRKRTLRPRAEDRGAEANNEKNKISINSRVARKRGKPAMVEESEPACATDTDIQTRQYPKRKISRKGQDPNEINTETFKPQQEDPNESNTPTFKPQGTLMETCLPIFQPQYLDPMEISMQTFKPLTTDKGAQIVGKNDIFVNTGMGKINLGSEFEGSERVVKQEIKQEQEEMPSVEDIINSDPVLNDLDFVKTVIKTESDSGAAAVEKEIRPEQEEPSAEDTLNSDLMNHLDFPDAMTIVQVVMADECTQDNQRGTETETPGESQSSEEATIFSVKTEVDLEHETAVQ